MFFDGFVGANIGQSFGPSALESQMEAFGKVNSVPLKLPNLIGDSDSISCKSWLYPVIVIFLWPILLDVLVSLLNVELFLEETFVILNMDGHFHHFSALFFILLGIYQFHLIVKLQIPFCFDVDRKFVALRELPSVWNGIDQVLFFVKLSFLNYPLQEKIFFFDNMSFFCLANFLENVNFL